MRSPASHNEGGFTLVELLVVIFIIGLLVSVISLRPGIGPPQEAEHAKDVAKTLRMLSRESIISGQPTAFGVAGSDYVLQRWTGETWADFEFDRQRLPGGLPSELTLADETSGDAEEEDGSLRQLVVFLPVGEATPQRLEFVAPGGSAALDVLANGDVVFDADSLP